MIDQEEFLDYVRQALAHINEPAYLENLPLINPTDGSGRPYTSIDIREILLQAIEELRPPPGTPQTSPSWRGYRYLQSRYVRGEDPDTVAQELMISDRQARREHHLALKAVAASLWRLHLRMQPRPPESDPVPVAAALEDEIGRLARTPAEGPTSVGEVLASASSTVDRLARNAGVSLEVRLPADLRPVRFSRSVLRQASVTLLSFGAGLGHGTRVIVSISDKGDVVTVSFDYRLRDSEGGRLTKSADDELRLATSRRLVGWQGGSLETKRPRGDQMLILLHLPAAPLSTVLVVDDNPDFIRLFRRYVAGQPYQILEANVASEALRLVQEGRPKVIILDVMMTALDGWEILQILKRQEETRQIPIVICSVLPEDSLARSLGVFEYIRKPISQRDLLAVLERCCPAPAELQG